MQRLKKLFPISLLLLFSFVSNAQETAAINSVADIRSGSYAFTNATVVKDAQTTITNATLLIKKGICTLANYFIFLFNLSEIIFL